MAEPDKPALAAGRVSLRPVTPADLSTFFEQQLDPEANRMAAFTVPDPPNRAGFDAYWGHILSDGKTTARTVLYDGQVAGNVMSFVMFGLPSVSYWIGKEYWGKGIAMAALAELLKLIPVHPLYARAAQDNLASVRVLQKCGFRITGEDRGYANARGAVVDEYILELSPDGSK